MDGLHDWQGTWEAVFLAEDGRRKGHDDVRGTRVTISGECYTLLVGGFLLRGSIAGVDPARNRGAVDFLGPDGAAPGERWLGLYLLEDDELTICVAPPGRPRPRALESQPGTGHRLYLLKRLTPAPTPAVEVVPGEGGWQP